MRAVAIATGALPVYLGIGGCLAITESGEVLLYDPESREVAKVAEVEWRKAAYVAASERYPELKALAPPRPPDAETCPDCGGKGRRFGSAYCGSCFGTGWIKGQSGSAP
jgi:RNA polymerase subunit RPABC4/transcription elongation factor Spt4